MQQAEPAGLVTVTSLVVVPPPALDSSILVTLSGFAAGLETSAPPALLAYSKFCAGDAIFLLVPGAEPAASPKLLLGGADGADDLAGAAILCSICF